MSFLFGPSLEERSQLVRTLHALGPSSIDALAAALSWSPRKTERLVTALARRGEGGIWYAPQLRQVRIGPPPEMASDRAPSADSARAAAPAPPVAANPGAPPPLPSPAGFSRRCPACHATMQAVGDGDSLVCPGCGRLSFAPRRSAAPTPASPAPGPAPGAPTGDRRAQEMLAAYVTSRPILCPRCRAPLRHQGVGSFRCPACGEAVTFSGGPSAPAPPPLPTVAAARAR